jgi:hypothetical protein
MLHQGGRKLFFYYFWSHKLAAIPTNSYHAKECISSHTLLHLHRHQQRHYLKTVVRFVGVASHKIAATYK